MEGLNKISARIEQDARNEAAKVIQAAEDEASMLLNTARADARAKADAVLKEGRRRADERQERLTGLYAMEARRQRLFCQQELIDEAFRRAEEALNALSPDQKATLCARLAAKASRNGREEIVLSPADHARFGKKVLEDASRLYGEAHGKPGGFTLSATPRPMAGGLVLSDGPVEVNCTFEALLRGLKESLVADVAGKLF